MTTNFPQLKLGALYGPVNSETPHHFQMESPTQQLEMQFSNSFEKKGSGGEINDFLLQTPNEFLLFSETKPKDPWIDTLKTDREELEATDNFWWILNDSESLGWGPKNSSDDIFQDCSLRKRSIYPKLPDEPSILPQKLTFPEKEHSSPQKKFKKGVGCSCAKSKCLRLHCKCFNSLPGFKTIDKLSFACTEFKYTFHTGIITEAFVNQFEYLIVAVFSKAGKEVQDFIAGVRSMHLLIEFIPFIEKEKIFIL